ncbi:MAG: phosphate signaling complex protein PhoU [Treponemataceae bacterium]
MRKQFDEQLARLRGNMKKCGKRCADSLLKSTRIFFESDLTLLESVFSLTRSIDKRTHKIENMCFMLLLRQQPVAIDLRTITATLKVNFDLKRIASQSYDIAEIVKISALSTQQEIDPELLEILHTMADQSNNMLTQALATFFDQDIEGAQKVIDGDDVVDECFAKVKACISSDLASSKKADYFIDILMIAKYYERISDHCVNIAKWTLKYFG